MKKIKLFVLTSLIVALGACQKDYETPTIPGSDMSEEWWVQFTVGGVDVYNLGHMHFMTYTTAAADGKELYIDDLQNAWQFKAKCPITSLGSRTFAGDSLQNEYYDVKASVRNGKVFPGAGRSRTGRKTDSIYMEIEFADDPGTVYEYSGHARTGFLEDDF